eukprot:9503831-Pyramimonas_sp.AAC.4
MSVKAAPRWPAAHPVTMLGSHLQAHRSLGDSALPARSGRRGEERQLMEPAERDLQSSSTDTSATQRCLQSGHVLAYFTRHSVGPRLVANSALRFRPRGSCSSRSAAAAATSLPSRRCRRWQEAGSGSSAAAAADDAGAGSSLSGSALGGAAAWPKLGTASASGAGKGDWL